MCGAEDGTGSDGRGAGAPLVGAAAMLRVVEAKEETTEEVGGKEEVLVREGVREGARVEIMGGSERGNAGGCGGGGDGGTRGAGR